MILFLSLNIILTVGLFTIFKYFSKFKIDNLQAITTNYFVAGALGYLITKPRPEVSGLMEKDWFIYAALLGVLFVALFLVLAYSSQKIGVAITTTANKIAVVIPVAFGVVVLGESFDWMKGLGVLLALIAIVFVSKSGEKTEKLNLKLIIIPLILFVGGGVIDTSLGVLQTRMVPQEEASWLTISLFWISGCIGLTYWIILLILKKSIFSFRNIVAGIVLGVPNYFCIYFLLRAIDTEVLETSSFFPIANLGSILFAMVIGRIVFKESLTRSKIIGVLLSIIAIILIVWKDL